MYWDSRVAILKDQISYYPKSNAGFENMPEVVMGTPAVLEVCMNVYMYACMYACMYICMFIVYVCMYVCMYVCKLL